MESRAAKIKKYQERAKQIRAIAEDVRGSDNRKYLLEAAADYEQMANDADRKSKT